MTQNAVGGWGGRQCLVFNPTILLAVYSERSLANLFRARLRDAQNLKEEVESLQAFAGTRDRVNAQIAALKAENEDLKDKQELSVRQQARAEHFEYKGIPLSTIVRPRAPQSGGFRVTNFW